MENRNGMGDEIRVIPQQLEAQLDMVRSFVENLTMPSGWVFGGRSEAMDEFLRLYRLFFQEMAVYRGILEADLQNAGVAAAELEETDEQLLY